MADRLEVARDIVVALVANPNTALVKGSDANAIGEDIAAIYKARGPASWISRRQDCFESRSQVRREGC
jgi:hypothetical protein